MQILFYCGSLEPGRDGVGDYTRRLAGACAQHGHGCAVIALHDPGVTHPTDEMQGNLRLIRLPAGEPWPERLARARLHAQRFAPDWVSWQLVAYGLHPRGFLPAALLQSAPELRGPRCQVMLHELWLGLETGAGWRARALGWLQRRGILCLLDQLDPDVVQTSNPVYQFALDREGFPADLLELFGNVPVAARWPGPDSPFARWLPGSAGRSGAPPLIAVTLGTLHPQWAPAAAAAWLHSTALRLGRQPVLVVLGHSGPHVATILDKFRQQGVRVAITGELEVTTLSQLLAAADFGFAPHPWALIGKSGAAAAMREHGLPVLVPRDDWQLRGESAPPPAVPDPLLTRLAGLEADHTDRWLAARREPESFLPRVADAFLGRLNSTPPHAG